MHLKPSGQAAQFFLLFSSRHSAGGAAAFPRCSAPHCTPCLCKTPKPGGPAAHPMMIFLREEVLK